jgi:hypothetical protein
MRMLLAIAPGLALAANEGELRDPTRPPQQVLQAAASAGVAVADAPPAVEPVLQSVLVTSKGKSAIIDGERYKVGDTVAGARLVAIGDAEVVLNAAGVRKTLRLFPQVAKRSRDAAQAPKGAVTGNQMK